MAQQRTRIEMSRAILEAFHSLKPEFLKGFYRKSGYIYRDSMGQDHHATIELDKLLSRSGLLGWVLSSLGTRYRADAVPRIRQPDPAPPLREELETARKRTENAVTMVMVRNTVSEEAAAVLKKAYGLVPRHVRTRGDNLLADRTLPSLEYFVDGRDIITGDAYVGYEGTAERKQLEVTQRN